MKVILKKLVKGKEEDVHAECDVRLHSSVFLCSATL